MCPARPSLHWVPAVPGSPPSAVLWLAPTPRLPSRRTSFPSLGSTTLRCLAMQAGSNASLSARSSVGPRADSFPWRSRGLPGSWGILVCMPCSRDPGEARHTKTGKVRGGSLPALQRRRPSRVACSRGSVTRPTHSLSTLRSKGHPGATQDSLPAGCLALTGRVLSPRDSSRSFRLSSSPSSKLGLAQCRSSGGVPDGHRACASSARDIVSDVEGRRCPGGS